MAGAGARYDSIGRTYATTRREDPFIAEQIHAVIGGGSVVNIGAGTGNYEPTDRRVVAVEPSGQMIAQRAGRSAPVVRGVAEALPFPDGSFDVAMAVLTVHHWSDPTAGLAEMARVADRQVIFYFESLTTHGFWALDYFPTAMSLPTEQDPPGEQLLSEHLDVHEIRTLLVPRDCLDGFGVAFWARPEAYLDPDVQAGMSWLALLSDDDRARGTERPSAPTSPPANGTVATGTCATRSSTTAAIASPSPDVADLRSGRSELGLLTNRAWWPALVQVGASSS